MYNKKKRGILATAGALVTAAALALGGAAAANAVDGAAGPLILPGGVDQPITGTVTVHKHEQGDEAGVAANGLEKTVTSAPIPGVTFTAQQVESFVSDGITYDIDLTKNAGWEAASKLVYNASTDKWSFNNAEVTPVFGDEVVRTTGPANGAYQNAVFADLPVGLYHFAETLYPVDVTPSAPWVMSVPLTHPTENDSWLYNIHVYPKNSTTDISKTVDDSAGVKLGDAVTWTIDADLPRTANPAFISEDGASLTNLEFLAPTWYEIRDQLDQRLTLSSVNVTLVDGEGSALTGASVLGAADFTVTPTEMDQAGSNVVVTFTEAGLAKLGLAGSTPGAQVQVVIATTVNSVSNVPAAEGETPGEITNQAVLFPNKPSLETEGIPSDEPVTKWGDIVIHKVDASDNTKNLEGAVFSVFDSKEAALAGTAPIALPGTPAQTTFTTGADGTVRISGLRQSGWADNADQLPYIDVNGVQTAVLADRVSDNAKYRTYWLVEVKSPDGYELLAEPVEVVVDAAGATVKVTEIKNPPANGGFELPLTGGSGTLFLTILGVGILAVVLIVARRRNAIAATE